MILIHDYVLLLIAAGLGSILGLEREFLKKPAGIKTHALVALGAALLVIASRDTAAGYERVLAQIVSGIGFIGAGTIMKMKNDIVGITTAASLWISAGIGIAVGIGHIDLAVVTIIIGELGVILINFIKYLIWGKADD